MAGRRARAERIPRAPRREEPEAERSTGSIVWEQASTLIVAVAIALGIRAFVIEPFRIPSGSMFPTLLIGDHLFVNKFIYGARIPLTETRLPALREPERGDVVVFTVAKDGSRTYPVDERPDLPREEFVKRIIGLPGDRIEFRRGIVYLNGRAFETELQPERFSDERGYDLDVLEVRLESDRRFRILDDPRSSHPDPAPQTVPEGRYFMLGDNRDYSKDSRYWGTVRLEELKGPAYRLYWSWNFNGTWGELLNPATWVELLTEKMRWDRIGDRVQ